MKKITKTLRFDEEVINHAENNSLIKSFPEWAGEAYRKQFMSIEEKERQLKEAEKVIDELKRDIESLKTKDKMAILSDKEKEWIRTVGVERVAKFNEEGVYMLFINTFNRPDINRRQFRLLIDESRKQIGGNPGGK